MADSRRAEPDDSLKCSFCHKSQDVVGKLISSPSDYPRAYICPECIAVCYSILEDDKPKHPSAPPHPGLNFPLVRAQLRLLLDDIPDSDLPDSDLPTVAKILEALIPR